MKIIVYLLIYQISQLYLIAFRSVRIEQYKLIIKKMNKLFFVYIEINHTHNLYKKILEKTTLYHRYKKNLCLILVNITRQFLGSIMLNIFFLNILTQINKYNTHGLFLFYNTV